MKYPHSPTKTPNLHSARRRDRFIVPVFFHCQIRIFTSSNTHIHFITHTFLFPICGYIRIWGRDKSAPTAANGLPTTLQTNWNNVANTPQNIHIHPRKHPTYIPPGVGADSSCPYFSIAKSVFSHHQIRIFVSSQTHFCSPFCGYIRIWGHDKSVPTAANGLPTTLLTDWNNVANTPQNIHVCPRKHPTYIPPGVGADSSRPYFSIAKYAFTHYQIRIFVSSQTHFRSSFCGYIRIWGHDKSGPYAC